MDPHTDRRGPDPLEPRLALRLLGGMDLDIDGMPADISESAQRLLAYVALQRRPVRRPPLAATLWPGADERRAAGNLRSAVWRLRSLAPSLLVVATTIRLGGDVAVDVDEHAGWAARVLGGRATDLDLVLTPHRLDGLDLLRGWHDEWALIERERIRQRTLHALETLSVRLVERRMFGEAVDAALLAVSADPLRESAQRTLITAHLAEGNVVEALRAFDRYERLLRAELQVEPSPALRALRPPGASARAPHVRRARRPSPALR